jgi:hypothetical protein
VAEDGTSIPIPEEEQEAIRAECGCLFANDWRTAHLGTKWGLCETSEQLQGDELHIYADTAWGPPVEFFRQLAEWYPDLHISLAYTEEGNSFAGVVSWHDGAEIEESFEGEMYMLDSKGEEYIHSPEYDEFVAEHLGREYGG